MEDKVFDLGGFCLEHSCGSMDVSVESTISVPQQFKDVCLDTLSSAWIRPARNMALSVELSPACPSLTQEQLSALADGVVNAEVCLDKRQFFQDSDRLRFGMDWDFTPREFTKALIIPVLFTKLSSKSSLSFYRKHTVPRDLTQSAFGYQQRT